MALLAGEAGGAGQTIKSRSSSSSFPRLAGRGGAGNPVRRATTIRTVLTGPLRALTVALAAIAFATIAPGHAPATTARAPATPASAPATTARAPATIAPAPATTASAPATPTRTVVIGHSVKGRPIIAIVRGPNDAPRKILVVGCIHGNECAGLAIISALKRAAVVKGVQLWLVPGMNPDGTAADTRQNADGVDLNRNFPYQWQPISDPIYYSGPRPLSEPETRAAVRLIRRIKPAVTIWYHQHEDLVDMAGGDRGAARRYAQLAHLPATCLPFLPGTAPAWSNHAFPGTTAFVVELPAGPVASAALADHLRAVRAMELDQRSGSRTSCGP
jgi:murein peptide amidase A